MKVFIVEDDANYRNSLVSILGKELDYKIVGISDNYTDALVQIRSTHPDIVISDYHLKGELTGLDLGIKLNFEKINVLLISEDGSDALYDSIVRKSGLSFLVKPFHKYSLDSAVKKILDPNLIEDNCEHVVINTGFVSSVVDVNDILYIESERNYTSIITSKKKFVVRSSFVKLLKELKEIRMVRIHKRYAIPFHHIKSINFSKSLVNIGTNELPLGRTYIKELKLQFGVGFKNTHIVSRL